MPVAGGNWGVWTGLGQGLQNAGNSVVNALEFAQQMQIAKRRQSVEEADSQSARDSRAAQTYYETGQDLPGYNKGQRGAAIANAGPSTDTSGAVNQSPAQPSGDPQGTPSFSDTQNDTTGALSGSMTNWSQGDISQQRAPGLGPANDPNQGSVSPMASSGRPMMGGRPGLGGSLGAGMTLNGPMTGGSQSPVIRALQSAAAQTPAPTNQSMAGQVPSPNLGIDPSQLAGLPPAGRNQAVLQALLAAQQYKNAAALRGIPQAVNPDELALQQGQLAEWSRHNQADEANQRENIRIMGGIRSAMMGLTEDRTAEGMATKFADQTKDDRKAGTLAQQLDDAYGQAMGLTTPDGKPNATALKALIVNQIANTEPGMQVRQGTLKFNGTGGDMSAAGQVMSNISVAIGGLPLQQQMQALHGLAQQMIRTKAQRYASMYQAEAAAHPDIPQYEQRYLAPTMSPQLVFGHYAPQSLNLGTLSQAKAALTSGKDPTAVKSHYSDLTGRDFDTDVTSGTTAAAATTAPAATGAGKP